MGILFIMFISVIMGGVFGILWDDALTGFITGSYIGLLFGPSTGFIVLGGRAYIQHIILRLFFYLSGYMPLNYVRFLDYCAERILLRKVGGGYIFIHRLLLEHFASLSEEDIKRLASSDPPPSSISPPIPP